MPAGTANSAPFEHWLAAGGLGNRPLAELFDGFTAHLLSQGVDLRRAYFGMSTRHPLIRAFDLTWEIGRREGRADGVRPYLGAHLRLAGQPAAPHDPDGPVAHAPPAAGARTRCSTFRCFEELAARGLTEWYGAVNGFEANSAVQSAATLGMACSWSTANRPASRMRTWN
jgi:hypothetical protein